MDKTTKALQQQVAAMGIEVFEVGLFKPSARDEGRAVMIPRTWDVDTLTRSIPWLRLQNADGRNIYIRPKGEHDLSLVDDLTAANVQRMRGTGFTPAVVVETSPGNFQSWLKHPRILSKELSTAAGQALAERFDGDPGAADWRHFGRLAGFTNRKEKYKDADGLFPFVRVREAAGGIYPAGDRFLEDVETQLKVRERFAASKWLGGRQEAAPRQLKPIEQFRANPTYGGDGTRIDLAYSIYALAHGAPEATVAETIRSRDLSHKGSEKRQEQYVDRTIRKALSVVERKDSAMQR